MQGSLELEAMSEETRSRNNEPLFTRKLEEGEDVSMQEAQLREYPMMKWQVFKKIKVLRVVFRNKKDKIVVT